ncbi:acyl carrier protein [Actinoplanes sp. G11-F43]|uniref:acyl carrier protein n=1 Tax=Actinoplanes sp. G11-F43 TaxID=3424130 RepID=UPI003D336B89
MTTPATRPSMGSIREQIVHALVEEFWIPPDRITVDTRFVDLGFDSLGLVELAIAIRKRFGVMFRESEITRSMTVNSTAELVASRVAR